MQSSNNKISRRKMPGLAQGKGGKADEMMITSLAELSDWFNLFSETEPHCKQAEAVLILSHWVWISKQNKNPGWIYTSEGLNWGFFGSCTSWWAGWYLEWSWDCVPTPAVLPVLIDGVQDLVFKRMKMLFLCGLYYIENLWTYITFRTTKQISQHQNPDTCFENC